MWGEDGPSAIWRNFTKAMTERVQNHPLYPEDKDSKDELLDQAIMEQLTLYGATTDWEDFDDPLHFPRSILSHHVFANLVIKIVDTASKP
jgi:hypothetical protein